MRKRLLTTPVFSVEHREYARAGSGPICREVIVHPGAVVILPLLDDNRIVMIRNYRYSVEQELWELPAGTMEPEEAPLRTAERELREETGYRASKLSPLLEFYTSPGICTERMHAFIATGLTHVGQDLQEGERITAEPLAGAEVRRRLLEGEFQDGKTIAVLGYYFLRGAP